MVAASPVLLGPLMLARYDLWPALFLATAMWAIVVERPRVAAVALGLGVLAKVYPLLVAPFVVVYLWRRLGGREAIVFSGVLVGVIVLGYAPFFVLGPDGVATSITRNFERPLQVESIGAVLLYALDAAAGMGLRVVHTFDSYNLAGPLADSVARVQTVALGAVLLVTMLLFVRGNLTLPQYLMWLVAPFVLVRGGRWSPHLIALAAAVVLTGAYYPKFYTNFFRNQEVAWIALVLVRDLVLVGLTGYLVLRLRAPRARNSA